MKVIVTPYVGCVGCGVVEGAADGTRVGALLSLGSAVGNPSAVGSKVGLALGAIEGTTLFVGLTVGSAEGSELGVPGKTLTDDSIDNMAT